MSPAQDSLIAAMKRILLVEDEPTTREILAEVLRGEGYTVDTVAGVSTANVCLGSLEYELVVADWLLPDGDGVAVADRAVRVTDAGPEKPEIVVDLGCSADGRP